MDTTDIAQRLSRIEQALETLIAKRTVKEYYSTEEVAEITGRSPFTIRQYCNHGRIRAEKRRSGRGVHKEWMISHDELVRCKTSGFSRRHINDDRIRPDRHAVIILGSWEQFGSSIANASPL